MDCQFFVGQKVVKMEGDGSRISDAEKRSRAYWLPNYPVVGETYTVRNIHIDLTWGTVRLLLAEVVNPKRTYRGITWECGFLHTHFRPATDISIFHKLVEKARKTGRVTVDA